MTSRVGLRYRDARNNPPSAPIAAASAGVARPPRMVPSTIMIKRVSGTKETTRSI
jgi:hypothetical protein